MKRFKEDDETVIQLIAQNTSGIPAVNVWLEVLKGPQGEEVLPSFWNENALLLLPGEQRSITVRYRTKDLHDTPPASDGGRLECFCPQKPTLHRQECASATQGDS